MAVRAAAAFGPQFRKESANEVYAPSVTAGIYLVNFVFLYMANPDLAAYLPAYKAPVPQAIVDCLEQNPTGCPYADYRRYFDQQVFRQQGMLLAGGVSGEREMGAPGPTESQTTTRYQRAIGEEAGRSIRSPPWHGRRYGPD